MASGFDGLKRTRRRRGETEETIKLPRESITPTAAAIQVPRIMIVPSSDTSEPSRAQIGRGSNISNRTTSTASRTPRGSTTSSRANRLKLSMKNKAKYGKRIPEKVSTKSLPVSSALSSPTKRHKDSASLGRGGATGVDNRGFEADERAAFLDATPRKTTKTKTTKRRTQVRSPKPSLAASAPSISTLPKARDGETWRREIDSRDGQTTTPTVLKAPGIGAMSLDGARSVGDIRLIGKSQQQSKEQFVVVFNNADATPFVKTPPLRQGPMTSQSATTNQDVRDALMMIEGRTSNNVRGERETEPKPGLEMTRDLSQGTSSRGSSPRDLSSRQTTSRGSSQSQASPDSRLGINVSLRRGSTQSLLSLAASDVSAVSRLSSASAKCHDMSYVYQVYADKRGSMAPPIAAWDDPTPYHMAKFGDDPNYETKLKVISFFLHSLLFFVLIAVSALGVIGIADERLLSREATTTTTTTTKVANETSLRIEHLSSIELEQKVLTFRLTGEISCLSFRVEPTVQLWIHVAGANVEICQNFSGQHILIGEDNKQARLLGEKQATTKAKLNLPDGDPNYAVVSVIFIDSIKTLSLNPYSFAAHKLNIGLSINNNDDIDCGSNGEERIREINNL